MNKRQQFLKATREKPPTELLRMAVELQNVKPKPLKAVDMGCGAGNDTKFLLEAGYNVFAFDIEPDAISATQERCQQISTNAELRTQVCSFTEVELPGANLINASFALPFNGRDGISGLWDNIYNALSQGGLFVFQLFGLEDEWSSRESMYFVSESELDEIRTPYETEFLKETKQQGRTAVGGTKFWHVYHLVLRKPMD